MLGHLVSVSYRHEIKEKKPSDNVHYPVHLLVAEWFQFQRPRPFALGPEHLDLNKAAILSD